MKLADKIFNRLINFIRQNPSDIVIPNYYSGRWEMDVCRITRADICYEYEIKISRADYLKDFKKEIESYRNGKQNKHELQLAGKRISSHFYFVCPAGLIDKDEIPKNYGLIYAYLNPEKTAVEKIVVEKKARALHNKKVTDANPEFYKTIAINLNYRFNNLRIKTIKKCNI